MAGFVCDECNSKTEAADTFIYKEKKYCMGCLFSLLMELCEDGVINIDFSEDEENGLVVNG